MKVALPLLGLGFGLLALSGRDSAPAPTPGMTPFGPPPPPEPPRRAEPEPPPKIVFVPPFTVPPNGRHLSAAEKLALSPFTYKGGIEPEDVDRAILWWGSPESSFASDDGGHIIALTTARGIYLRGLNHEIVRHDELATLGHELMHVGQFRRGEVPKLTEAEREFPAYQMGLTIRTYLDEAGGASREWNA